MTVADWVRYKWFKAFYFLIIFLKTEQNKNKTKQDKTKHKQTNDIDKNIFVINTVPRNNYIFILFS